MNKLKTYFFATRPWSFVVSVMPVIATAAYLFSRGCAVNWWMALWTIVSIVMFHAAANTLSDYFDFKKGVDAEDTYGAVMLTHGTMAVYEMHRLAMGLTVAACVNGLGIALVCGWPILIIGGIGAAIAIGYAWLKYHAIGDLAILFDFGILPALGTSVAVCGGIVWDSLWIVLAVVPITMAVLHSNNTRDIPTDGRADILTVPMIVGKKASQIIYYVMVLMPCAWVVAMVIAGKMHWAALAILVSLKLVKRNCTIMHNLDKDEHAIDHLDEMTAQLQTISGLLLVVSLLIAGIIRNIAI